MPAPLKRSGLQNEVVSFYRQCFRAARDKPLESRPRFHAFIRREFKEHNLKKSDFATIEYMLRKGRKQFDTYSQKGVKDVHL
ncbi:hypothetical protein INT47_001648 [Mucor saturninus]|uniref:Complex 1 LYR protein domain-containing protein n=1 Tax=Mucor saturninus TaxID=64648 RepID=A0A8H7VF76_9FUNG|nr:hypothetical protein INT47_001648 [Mucor saturninus]